MAPVRRATRGAWLRLPPVLGDSILLQVRWCVLTILKPSCLVADLITYYRVDSVSRRTGAAGHAALVWSAKRPFEPTSAPTTADLHIAAVGGLELQGPLRACSRHCRRQPRPSRVGREPTFTNVRFRPEAIGRVSRKRSFAFLLDHFVGAHQN